MHAIPVFPKLTYDMATRIEKAIMAMLHGDVSEAAFVECYDGIVGAILRETADNPRVQGVLEAGLPPLAGMKLCFHFEKLSPWILTVGPITQALSWRLAVDGEAKELSGFSGDTEIMTAMITGAADASTTYQAIVKGRLNTINASPANPASHIKDLFALIGPVLDRKDVMEMALSNAAPVISERLRNLGY